MLANYSTVNYQFLLWIIMITPLRVFQTSVSWWFLTGVWVTASLHKSLGLSSVFTRPLISSPCTNFFGDLPRAPIKIGITITFMFHSFFFSLERSRNFSFFRISFNFTLCSAGIAKSTILHVLFIIIIIIIIILLLTSFSLQP